MQRKRWLLVSHLFFIFPQKNKGERFVRISLPYLFEVVYFPTAPFRAFSPEMWFTPYRGLAQVTNWVKLKFAAMTLKKLTLWLTREGENSPLFVQNLLRWLNFIENTKNPVLSCFKTGFFDSLQRLEKSRGNALIMV